MVGSISGSPTQVAYVKAQQTSGNFRQAGAEGVATAQIAAAERRAKPETVQFSRSAEANDSQGGNKGDKKGLDRFATDETVNAEAVRGSLIDISV